MMTQQLEVSILAAPLAAIDRRALPQAWYSALHLARPQVLAQTLPVRHLCALRCAAKPACPARGEIGGTARSQTQSRQQIGSRSSRIAVSHAFGEPPNRVVGPLSKQVESKFSHPTVRLRRATFSLGRGNARVHVMLQSNGNRITLVALCRPEMRVVVAQALAQARVALAARGIPVERRTNEA
jgi:hypothetical protein